MFKKKNVQSKKGETWFQKDEGFLSAYSQLHKDFDTLKCPDQKFCENLAETHDFPGPRPA